MSIQRYLCVGNGVSPNGPGMWPTDEGHWVLFTDHEKAMEWAERRRKSDVAEMRDFMETAGAKQEDLVKAREQAIRDCIDVAETKFANYDLANALRAMLPKEES